MSIVTDAEALVSIWAPRLYLTHWHIQVIGILNKELTKRGYDESTRAFTNTDVDGQIALIALNLDYWSGKQKTKSRNILYNDPKYDSLEHCILHELAHLLLRDLDTEVPKDTLSDIKYANYQDELEQLCSTLAWIIQEVGR